jgi:acetylornithine/N-succinyldiaminopimelate aminotransferase
MGHDYLEAIRRRCESTGAMLIFDEVQCGVGRTGHPFAAGLYGVVPDMLTTAKALGAGFPVGALLLSPQIAAGLKLGELGSTFGGGPLACAVVEAVVDTIRDDNLLENVRNISARIRRTCVTGPVTGIQGEGFLLGLRTRVPARQVQAALLDRGILTGTSGDPGVLRLLPPFTLAAEHVDLLVAALSELPA